MLTGSAAAKDCVVLSTTDQQKNTGRYSNDFYQISQDLSFESKVLNKVCFYSDIPTIQSWLLDRYLSNVVTRMSKRWNSCLALLVKVRTLTIESRVALKA